MSKKRLTYMLICVNGLLIGLNALLTLSRGTIGLGLFLGLSSLFILGSMLFLIYRDRHRGHHTQK